MTTSNVKTVGDRVEFLIVANEREIGQGTISRVLLDQKHLVDIEMDNGERVTAWAFHVRKLGG